MRSPILRSSFCIATALFSTTLGAQPPGRPSPDEPATTEAAPTRLEVTTDARIELLAVVQLLAGYDATGLITRFDVDYKEAVEEHFRPFEKHAAVTWFSAHFREGFAFDGPPTAMLHFGAPPELAARAPVPEDLLARAGGKQEFDRFIEAMRAFARDTKFMEFFADHHKEFHSWASEVRQAMGDVDVGVLEKYYGEQKAGYRIVLAPLFHEGGFGPQITLPDGSLEVNSVQGPHGAAGGSPFFGEGSEFQYLVWHEFSHSFTNPLVDRNLEIVERTAKLFEPLREVMKPQAYGEWRTCVYEHIVRACTVRFSYREKGKEAGDSALEYETKQRGFAHLPALCRELERYEASRDRYPTLDSFFPELLAVFDRALTEKS